MSLTILTVSRLDDPSMPFLRHFESVARWLEAEFLVAADGDGAFLRSMSLRYPTVRVKSKGYIESVLDLAVAACRGDYILRLDDDETMSPMMQCWLYERRYETADHWKFARAHLWPDRQSMIYTPPLWPDWQTRLSVKAKSGGRTAVHAGSPFGGGELAPVAIEHWKFLVKTREERLRIAKTYDDFAPGYGTGNMKPFSLPEEAMPKFRVASWGDGTTNWQPNRVEWGSWR